MDALKLEQRAVDEVQPLIYDLSDRLNKVRHRRNEGDGRVIDVDARAILASTLLVLILCRTTRHL